MWFKSAIYNPQSTIEWVRSLQDGLSFISKLLNHNSYLGLWIAPHYYTIADFFIGNAGNNPRDIQVKWLKNGKFTTSDDLYEQLAAIVKRYILQGRVVSIALSTPDMFTVSDGFNAAVPPEEQNILPEGIQWDTLEYTVDPDEPHVFACMRQRDADFLHGFITRIKLFPAALVPSGRYLPEFLECGNIIECILPEGLIKHRLKKGKWVESVYIQNDAANGYGAAEIDISCPVKEEYRHIGKDAVCALDPVISFIDNPGFNCNERAYEADGAVQIQKQVMKICRAGLVGCGGAIALLLVVLFAGFLVNAAIGLHEHTRRAVVVSARKLTKEIAACEDRIADYKSLLSKRSALARVLYAVGKMAPDSVWFSEFKIGNGNDIVIIGHAYNEKGISMLLAGAQEIKGVSGLRLEYSEKISEKWVARQTGWKRKIPLHRFKVLFSLEG